MQKRNGNQSYTAKAPALAWVSPATQWTNLTRASLLQFEAFLPTGSNKNWNNSSNSTIGRIDPRSPNTTNKKTWEWQLKAQPPDNSEPHQEIWIYEDVASQLCITIIRSPSRAKKPQIQQAIPNPRNWWQRTSQQTPVVQNTVQPPRERATGNKSEQKERETSRSPRRGNNNEVAQTQIDPAESQPISSSNPSAHFHTNNLPIDPDDAIRQGWQEVDVGGSGDCGYRAVAAARQKAKKGETLNKEQAKEQGAELRAMTCLHAQKHLERFKSFWGPDPLETSEHRNGKPAPKDIGEWINLQANPKVWICGLALLALAEKTGLVIVTWKKTDREWVRATFASKFSRHTACIAKGERPVVIILRNGHYTYLSPPEAVGVPRTWMNDTKDKLTIDLTGNGRSSSHRTPSVHTIQHSTGTCRNSVVGVQLAHVVTTSGVRPRRHRVPAGSPSSRPDRPAQHNSHTQQQSPSSTHKCNTGIQHRLTGKQQPPTGNPPAEELIWTCSICSTVIKGHSKKQLVYRRINHMNLRHPGAPKRPEDRPFNPPLPIVHATNLIPPEQRAWSCAFCDHGLPFLSSRKQHEKSVRFHYQTKHKKRVVNHKTRHAALAKRRKASGAPPRILKRWSNSTEKDLHVNGHDLVQWEPHDKSIIGNWRPHLHRYTCRLCRKINVFSRVSKNSCTKTGGDCYWHVLPDQEKRKLLSIWQLTMQEAENLIPKPPNKKPKFEITKDLATVKKNRLVEQGIEPHPGPHLPHGHPVSTPILIKTINVQGVPGAWRALNAWSSTVLLLQDTPFSHEEFKAFSRSARSRHYKAYHVEASKDSGRPNGGVTTLVPTYLRQQPLSSTAGNVQICMIEGTAVINTYAFPVEQTKHAETVHHIMQHVY